MGDNSTNSVITGKEAAATSTPSLIATTVPLKDRGEGHTLPGIIEQTAEAINKANPMPPPPEKKVKLDVEAETKGNSLEAEALSICKAAGIEELARTSGLIDRTGQIPGLLDGGARDKLLQRKPEKERVKTTQMLVDFSVPLHFKTELTSTAPGLATAPHLVSEKGITSTLPQPGHTGHVQPQEKHKRGPKRAPKPRTNGTESAGKGGKSGSTGGGEGGEGNGLRHFSAIVKKKVEELGTTTYKDVADILTKESQAEGGKGQAISEKNLQRRVYDVLNVLAAIGAVKKEKKTISWRGMPEKITDVPEASPSPPPLQAQPPPAHPLPPALPPPLSSATGGVEECSDDTLEGLYHNRKAWEKVLEDKMRQVRESEENLKRCKDLAERNKQTPQYRPEHVFPVPFIVAVTKKRSQVQCLMNETGNYARLRFTDNFKIYKYKKILACLGDADAAGAAGEGQPGMEQGQDIGGILGGGSGMDAGNGYIGGFDPQVYSNGGYMSLYDEFGADGFFDFQDAYINPLYGGMEDFSTFPQPDHHPQVQSPPSQLSPPPPPPPSSSHQQEQEQEEEQEKDQQESNETNTEKQPPKLPQL